MEKTMAVYDVEPRYADRFADVTNQKEKVPFQVVAFTSLEALKEYAREHTIEILLISCTFSFNGRYTLWPVSRMQTSIIS